MRGKRSRSGQGSRIELRRVFPCSAVEAFDLWTDAGSVRTWMCPDPSVRIVDLEWDPIEGRDYRIDMDVGGEIVSFHGRFVRVQRPTLLVFTWISTKTEEQETRVSVEIGAVTGGAEIRLVHEELPSSQAASEHEAGWESILDRLEDALRRGG